MFDLFVMGLAIEGILAILMSPQSFIARWWNRLFHGEVSICDFCFGFWIAVGVLFLSPWLYNIWLIIALWRMGYVLRRSILWVEKQSIMIGVDVEEEDEWPNSSILHDRGSIIK